MLTFVPIKYILLKKGKIVRKPAESLSLNKYYLIWIHIMLALWTSSRFHSVSSSLCIFQFVEKGTFFEGNLNGNVVKLSSYIPRYSGDYTISVSSSYFTPSRN